MRGAVLLLLSSLMALAAAPAEARRRPPDWRWEGEVGYQGALRVPDWKLREGELRQSRFYLATKQELTLERKSATVVATASARAWVDPKRESQAAKAVFDLRALSVAVSAGPVKVETGFQEIPWGETFGLYIADIVNPRNYEDPLFNELPWVRIPVFALQSQQFVGKLTLQEIFVPVARQTRDPRFLRESLGVLPLAERPGYGVRDIGKASEFGGRASYLFESGLDLGLFYYRHFNRNLVYEATPASYVPVQEKIHSAGLTASQALGVFVFRADGVWNHDQPMFSPRDGTLRRADQWQAIVGADASLPDEWTLGAQLHFDRSDAISQYWVSAAVHARFWDSKLEADVFGFSGLGNGDRWLQPKLTWNVSGGLAISLRADWVRDRLDDGGSDRPGQLLGLGREDRLLTWISYRF